MNYTHKWRKAQEGRNLRVTLQAKRESLGWLQKDLAANAKVSVSTIGRAERGVPIRRVYAIRIALALGESIKDLGIKTVEPDKEP